MTDRQMLKKYSIRLSVSYARHANQGENYLGELIVLKCGCYWIGAIPLNNTDAKNCDDWTIIGQAILL